MSDIRTYLDRGMPVPGWFDALDAAVFQAVTEAHRQNNVVGDMLEIGVYKGRSAILLGFLLEGEESLVVNDLFGSETATDQGGELARHYPTLNRNEFEQHWLRYHSTMPEIFQEPSKLLHSSLQGRSFRFIHVDGSHEWEYVRHDVELSRVVSDSDAVVAFDDIRAPHAVGVAAAVWSRLIDGLTPLVTTERKLYASWSPDSPSAQALLHWAAGRPGAHIHRVGERDVVGLQAVHAASPLPIRLWFGALPPSLRLRLEGRGIGPKGVQQ